MSPPPSLDLSDLVLGIIIAWIIYRIIYGWKDDEDL